VGVAKSTISRLEQGGITDLRGQVIAKLAQVLGVSADYLLGLDVPEQDLPAEPATSTGRSSKGRRQAKRPAKAKA